MFKYEHSSSKCHQPSQEVLWYLQHSYLLVTFLTVVGVGPLQEVSLDECIQRLKQVLLVTNVHV